MMAATGLTREQIESCTDRGVTERPPVPGQSYAGFVVHPRKPGPLVLAIGHRHGERFILDLASWNALSAAALFNISL